MKLAAILSPMPESQNSATSRSKRRCTRMKRLSLERFKGTQQVTPKNVHSACMNFKTFNLRSVMRPPYGDVTEENAAFLNSLGYTVVTWSIDIQDWEKSTSVNDEENTVASALQSSADHNIILQHDVSLTVTKRHGLLTFFSFAINRFTIKQLLNLPPNSLPM